ncbi:hypothetical protein M8C13_04520 [Crossiella sp. SN42]|uniref:hypothetical protein n=1 Tax=Crossiella sp. SN42 TaxID=2944808 RepID=UPI00207C60E0|nr:hypothetical protein [Crossiella sp. SN42]MCO1575023.1 hypothetical protein [Crossiella sp. SN42]
MSEYRVTTPATGFTGVSAGVNFTNGVAEPVTDGPALSYFRAAGYGVEEIEPPETASATEPNDPPPADPPKPTDKPTTPTKTGGKPDKEPTR